MTNPENCSLCQMGAVIDPELTYTASGKIHGVSRFTVRRHVEHSETQEKFFNIPEEFITSRRKSVRTEDGWEIVNFKNTALPFVELRETLEEDLREAFTQPWPVRPSEGRLRVPAKVIAPADFQIGKVDVNGGTADTIQRVRTSVQRIIADMEEFHYDEIIMPELGDIIENFQNVSSQRETNDAYLTKQIRIARRLMAEIIRALAPYCDKLTYIAVPSNHCTVRVGPKSPASVPDDDYGIEISHQLEEIFEGREGYEHLQFVRPADIHLEEVVYYSEAADTTFLFAHGHQANNAFKFGEYVSKLAAYAHGPHHAVQIAMFGHFHNWIRYEWSGREIHVAPSSDNGSSWYSGKNGQWSRTGILVMDVVDGRSYSANIY